MASEDRMIPPPAQRLMAKRAGSTVTEVAGSHSVYVSQPQAVAAFIAKAAEELSTASDAATAGPSRSAPARRPHA